MSTVLTLLLSVAGLFWAANHLVTGAIGIATYYRVKPLIIGLTIVAIGTSIPEIIVGITAAINGQNDLALGNAIGSNIANIGLILGITILLRPLTLRSVLLRREYPLLLLTMLFTYSLMISGYLGVMDGCLFLVACIILIGYFLFLARHSTKDIFVKEYKQLLPAYRSMMSNCLSLSFGLIILPISAHFLVESAMHLALSLGVSELIVGLTILAIGTSLPQVATSLVAAYQGQDDIAVGNILGSNMFNLLLVMAFPGIINPSAFSQAILWRDIPVMFMITIVFWVVVYRQKKKMSRWHGGLLLLIYSCYIFSLVLNAVV